MKNGWRVSASAPKALRRTWMRPGQSAVSRPSKEVGAHRFSQRSYTDEQLDALLYTDLDELNS